MADLSSADFQVECVASKAYLPFGGTRGAESATQIRQASKPIKRVNRKVFGNLRKCIATLMRIVRWFGLQIQIGICLLFSFSGR